jgi:hypothetical protein
MRWKFHVSFIQLALDALKPTPETKKPTLLRSVSPLAPYHHQVTICG